MRKVFRAIRAILAPRARHIRIQRKVRKEWYGNQYGGFFVAPDYVREDAIIYSFGVGEDISFDKMVLSRHKCTVFAFDPTPRVSRWISEQIIPDRFVFTPVGLAATDGELAFFNPVNQRNVSGSFVPQGNVQSETTTLLEVKKFSTIIHDLKHDRVDLVKLDIEGSEYDVLEEILSQSHDREITQILIEFHDRFFSSTSPKSIDSIRLLNSFGFEVFGVSPSGEEVSFIRSKQC